MSSRLVGYLLFIAVTFSSCFTLRKIHDGQMHIIPAGYTGTVTIIFGQKDGAEIRKSNGMTVLEVPASGMLKTKSKLRLGLIHCDKFQFLYKSDKDSLLIPELGLIAKDNIDPNKIYMYNRARNGDTIRYTIGSPPNPQFR